MMMRYSAVFLLMLNVATFLWLSRVNTTSESESPPLKTPLLTLLSERQREAPEAQKTPKPTMEPTVAILPTPVVSQPALPSTNEASPTIENSETECVLLGGFADQAMAEKALGFLGKHQVVGKMDVVETATNSGYSVYLPAFKTRELALVKLRELKAQQIDSFIIAEGPNINGISLGLFSKEESAKKMLDQLKAKGVSAQMSTVSKIVQQFSIRVTKAEDASLKDDSLAQLSNSFAAGKLTRKVTQCPR